MGPAFLTDTVHTDSFTANNNNNNNSNKKIKIVNLFKVWLVLCMIQKTKSR